MPEGHTVLDPGRRRAGIGVIPGGVSVHLVADNYVVVARHSLPVACRVGGAGSEILPAHVGDRKVVIAFDDERVSALSDDRPIPDRLIPLRQVDFGLLRLDSTNWFHDVRLLHVTDVHRDPGHRTTRTRSAPAKSGPGS